LICIFNEYNYFTTQIFTYQTDNSKSITFICKFIPNYTFLFIKSKFKNSIFRFIKGEIRINDLSIIFKFISRFEIDLKDLWWAVLWNDRKLVIGLLIWLSILLWLIWLFTYRLCHKYMCKSIDYHILLSTYMATSFTNINTFITN